LQGELKMTAVKGRETTGGTGARAVSLLASCQAEGKDNRFILW